MSEPRSLILVAEDEPLASMAIRAQLEALGYQVLGPARDGDEAVALGRCFPVDLAIFDFLMPRRTGLEAARDLFDAAPTPVVLLSGFDARSLPEVIPRPPIFASLTKPADLADLRASLEVAAAAFAQWLAAEPRRQPQVDQLRDERTAIAAILEDAAGVRPVARAALDLVQQADEQGRTLLELARDGVARTDHHG